MSLKKCPDCGHEVSSSAGQCPNCGAYTRNSKIIIYVFFLISLILLAVFIYYAWYNSEDQRLKRINEKVRKEGLKWMNEVSPRFELSSAQLQGRIVFPGLIRQK